MDDQSSGVAVWELSGGALETEQSVTLGLCVAFKSDPQRHSPHFGTSSLTGSLAPLSTVVTQSRGAPIPRFADIPIRMEFFTIDP